MTEEPLVVSEASHQDRLSGVLALHLALQEARSERVARVHLAALLSVPLAGLALWPSLWSEVGRRAALTFWAFSAIAVLWAWLVEWRLAAHARAQSLSR